MSCTSWWTSWGSAQEEDLSCLHSNLPLSRLLTWDTQVSIVCAVQHLNICWYLTTHMHCHTYTYTGTTGSSFIDYVLCDPTACGPATVEEQFTEKIIFLPEPYFIAPMVPPRPPQITLDGEKKNL